MELRFGYFPAADITEPELLQRMIDQLPPAIRYLLAGVRFEKPLDSPAFLASLDRVLPVEVRRRYYVSDLAAFGVSKDTVKRGGPLHRANDGRDERGRYWHYATLVSRGVIKEA